MAVRGLASRNTSWASSSSSRRSVVRELHDERQARERGEPILADREPLSPGAELSEALLKRSACRRPHHVVVAAPRHQHQRGKAPSRKGGP